MIKVVEIVRLYDCYHFIGFRFCSRYQGRSWELCLSIALLRAEELRRGGRDVAGCDSGQPHLTAISSDQNG